MILDALALAAIAIGVVAAIGVVFVAMGEGGEQAAPAATTVQAVAVTSNGSEAATAATVRSGAQPETAYPQQPPPSTAPAATAGVETPQWQPTPPTYTVPAPMSAPRVEHNGYHGMTSLLGADPLLAGFLEVVMAELHTLRQQQEDIERRLKLIDGIAVLIEEMHASTFDRGRHSSASSTRAEPRRPTPGRAHRS